MFNENVPSFYNPKLDIQTAEEKFLLKRRIRLMSKIEKLDRDSTWYWPKRTRLTKQLKDTESKLGIKP